ncbi:MAG: EpsG family protein [Bacteroides sp.]|nr:EpsG family protein [Bacteroides sp.]
MIDFIPIQNYVFYFDVTILCMIIIAVWQCHSGSILRTETSNLNAMWGIMFSCLLIPYMGLRPIKSGYFGDTINYAKGFYGIQMSNESFVWNWSGEWFFENLLSWFAINSDIHLFFLFCAFIYVSTFWLSTIRIFKNYYYIPFLVILSMFTFWQYGVNGIRNGLGASIFILAMTYVNKPMIMICLGLLACGCHNSIYLMAASAGLAWFLKNSYYYLIGWLLSVGLSYIIGPKIQAVLASLNIFGDDNRLSDYLTGDAQTGEIIQTSMTFRWDFLAYSAMGVAVGYYFIFRRNFKDEYYHWIYNTYLATNAFWVLVIRAAYSNRFAQISWFILPIVLIYPFLKQRFWPNHEKMLGYAIILFYVFTFYYNILKG